MYRILPFRIAAAFIFFIFISCSKDSDEPTQEETPVTVSTSDFSLTMDENPINGQIIGSVLGSTNEGTVSFSITEQAPSGAFSIDAISGELKVADETLFDFETNPTIIGTVKVVNGAISKNAIVTITLNDLLEENIYEGNVNLKTQDEVNNFGANNYTHITGALFIGIGDGTGFSDIHDLSPLNALERIDNNFLIGFNGNLTSTAGIENIRHLGGDLNFLNNPLLTNIVGLNNITAISGTLFIYNNDSLVNLDGLNQISSVNGFLQLYLNPLIYNLEWLGNLISIGQQLTINYCPSITNVDALSNLTNVGGSITINGNTALENLNGLQNLNATIPFLGINYNSSLINLNGIQNITPTSSLGISHNDMLQSLEGLEHITTLEEGISIIRNPSLTNLQGLNNLTDCLNLEIEDNEGLTSLNGLNNLSNIYLTLKVIHNLNLTDFCDLQNLMINGHVTSYTVYLNAFNPTKQDIIDGNCSL
ncbi:cadherin repeat domain-containing protein [Aequorivita sp. CIP111184]|uniref:cadherin repeat domain-containing protein n=1 Tax=Aequorivita sp. CIP111184 TaxID=2211356 RepID=UPI000DBBB99A|nr:cadherin repeat domain-containing protein [Aequorivita sp. CIP111184]SRX55590.1 hypothetical protein AEQU1_02614 [Aequorivita sp. CIP111184]